MCKSKKEKKKRLYTHTSNTREKGVFSYDMCVNKSTNNYSKAFTTIYIIGYMLFAVVPVSVVAILRFFFVPWVGNIYIHIHRYYIHVSCTWKFINESKNFNMHGKLISHGALKNCYKKSKSKIKVEKKSSLFDEWKQFKALYILLRIYRYRELNYMIIYYNVDVLFLLFFAFVCCCPVLRTLILLFFHAFILRGI